MKISIYQVDAFASQVFEGNPAAVCPLPHWLPDEQLRQIAQENNLSETAFIVSSGQKLQLRWFTPNAEVDLCGHATLASAHVLYQHLGFNEQQITFDTKSGELRVSKSASGYTMDFPASLPTAIAPPAPLLAGLAIPVKTVLAAFDYIVILNNEQEVKNLDPDFSQWLNLDLRGVVVTAPGSDVDFVSRCFYPKYRVNEDPVTGSAHCQLAPYWRSQLNKDKLTGRQLSSRSGLVLCELVADRVLLSGNAVDYMAGEITI